MNTKYGTVLTTDNGNLCSTIADIKKVLIVYTICGITILDIWANKLDLKQNFKHLKNCFKIRKTAKWKVDHAVGRGGGSGDRQQTADDRNK